MNEHRSAWSSAKFTSSPGVLKLVSRILREGYGCDALVEVVDWLAWQIQKERDQNRREIMRKWFKPSTIFALRNFDRVISDMQGDPMPDKDPPPASPWAGVVGW